MPHPAFSFRLFLPLVFVAALAAGSPASAALTKFVICNGHYSHMAVCENIIEITFPNGEPETAFDFQCSATKNDFRSLALSALCYPPGDPRRCDYIALHPADKNFDIGVFGVSCPK